MENASKALIMAGGILIGVLIMSLAVYLFVDFGSTSAQINNQNTQKQLAEFNSKFTSYENYKDSLGNWNINIYNIITLAGYANENNKYYGLTSSDVDNENYIDIKIGNKSILDSSETDLIDKYVSENGLIIKFKWTDTSYSENGRIKSMNFQSI